VLILLAVLVVTGLAVGRANDFDPDAEDIESFFSSVSSISVPWTTTTNPCPATVATITTPLLLRTVGTDVLFPLPATPPPPFDGALTSRNIGMTNQSVANGSPSVIWRLPASPCPAQLTGHFVAWIRYTFPGGGLYIGPAPTLRGRLYICPAGADPAGGPTPVCTPLGVVGSDHTQFASNLLTGLDLGTISTTVPAGQELVLKVIADNNGLNIGASIQLRWGSVSAAVANDARLDVVS
jgi:hypothetical protein